MALDTLAQPFHSPGDNVVDEQTLIENICSNIDIKAATLCFKQKMTKYPQTYTSI